MKQAKEKKWYVVYSKPRWEKKLHARLIDAGIEAYCPLNKVKKRWSDRIKMVEVPLFTSYVFVHIHEGEKTRVRETSGAINFIYTEGKPAVVRDIEIERIQRFLNEFENVEVVHDIVKNQRVTITQGLFVEKGGRVIDLQNNKAIVEVESLGYSLIAVFDASTLRSNKFL